MDPKKPLSLPAVRVKWRYDLLAIGGLAAAVVAYSVAALGIFPGWGTLVPLAAFWTVLGVLSGAGMTRVAAAMYAVMGDADVRRRLPGLWKLVDVHARKAGIPTPEVFLLHPRAPAACAWGSGSARRGVGLRMTLVALPPQFISAMLAHEIAHLKNRDESVFNVIAALIRGLGASMMLMLILTGFRLLGELLARPATMQHALSSLLIILVVVVTWFVLEAATSLWIPKLLQQHEFAADQLGAVISGDPVSLICALATLEAHEGGSREPQPGDAPSTHPPLQARINELMRLWMRMVKERR